MITDLLDKIASNLQERGLVKEATDIDVISNTINQMQTPGKPINPTVQYTTKSNYGGPEMIYVTSEHAEPLKDLTGTKTLTDRHVTALKQLGFVLQRK
jgi:hypothetical protein